MKKIIILYFIISFSIFSFEYSIELNQIINNNELKEKNEIEIKYAEKKFEKENVNYLNSEKKFSESIKGKANEINEIKSKKEKIEHISDNINDKLNQNRDLYSEYKNTDKIYNQKFNQAKSTLKNDGKKLEMFEKINQNYKNEYNSFGEKLQKSYIQFDVVKEEKNNKSMDNNKIGKVEEIKYNENDYINNISIKGEEFEIEEKNDLITKEGYVNISINENGRIQTTSRIKDEIKNERIGIGNPKQSIKDIDNTQIKKEEKSKSELLLASGIELITGNPINAIKIIKELF